MPDKATSLIDQHDDAQRRIDRANRQARLVLLAAVVGIGVFAVVLTAYLSTVMQQMNVAPPILYEEYDLPPAPTVILLPTPTPPPPTPDAWRLVAEARASRTMSDTKPLRGPLSGRMLQNTRDMVTTFDTYLDLSEFVLETSFINPDNEAIGAWDYGFIFLDDPKSYDNQYRFIVNAKGKWAVEFVEHRPAAKEPIFTTVEYGWVPAASFNFGAGEANHVRLILAAGQLSVYINGTFLAAEPVDRFQHGGLKVATCLWNGDAIDGHYTRFEDFTVWALLKNGTPQP
jgi:hypothetical protein